MKEQQKTCCFYDPLDITACKAMEERVCESRECTMHMTAQGLKDSRLASYKRRAKILKDTARRLGFVITLKAAKSADC